MAAHFLRASSIATFRSASDAPYARDAGREVCARRTSVTFRSKHARHISEPDAAIRYAVTPKSRLGQLASTAPRLPRKTRHRVRSNSRALRLRRSSAFENATKVAARRNLFDALVNSIAMQAGLDMISVARSSRTKPVGSRHEKSAWPMNRIRRGITRPDAIAQCRDERSTPRLEASDNRRKEISVKDQLDGSGDALVE